MCAATAIVQNKVTNLTILLACVHFYEKMCVSPKKTLLEYLQTKDQLRGSPCHHAIDAVVWGGDCNKVFGCEKHSLSLFDGIEYQCVFYPNTCTTKCGE